MLVAQAFLLAMSLAVVESIGHATPPVETTWWVVAARAGLSIPGHMAYLGCIALLVAEHGVRSARGWLIGLTIAAALHSVYDWAGLVPQLIEQQLPLDWPFRMVEFAIVYGTFVWVLRVTKRHAPAPITP